MTRLALVSIVLSTGGCLGIEGTDVSTGAAPSSEGDDGDDSLTSTAGDPTGNMTTDSASTDSVSTDPTGTGDDGPLSATDTADTATQGGTTDEIDTTGAPPTDSSGDGSEDPSDPGTGDTSDVDTDGTDTGTDSSSSDSGSESTGDDCGDGEIQADETCDGDDLQGFDCQSFGFAGGELGCDPVLCVFDMSACSR